MNAQLPPAFWQLDSSGPEENEIIVDSFAGGGGASTGIEIALGRSPDYAINHDPEALALHAANHPSTIHLSQNIYKVDPMDVVGRRKVGLLWASPDCKHFSKAKGGKPVKREIRDLAWTVVLWAERVRPRVIILENVEEFQTWGPLIETANGLMPCPDRRGETFREWIAALKKHGYRVEWKELRACDYGAPTTRKRLFLIARCDGKPITWPAATHGPGKALPYRTAASHVIDWSIPCPSIFDTADEIMAKLGIRTIRPLAENTLARIAKGVKRYVIDAVKPFIVDVAHSSMSPSGVKRWGDGLKSIDTPMGNVTAGGIQQGLVMPHLMTMRNAGKPYNEVDRPTHTVTAGGAGLSLVAPVLSAAQHGGSSRGADQPLHTVTASPKDQNQIIASTMVQTGYGEREGQQPRALDVDEPLGTVVAGGVKHAAVAAHLSKLQGKSIAQDAAGPIHTVGTKGRAAVVATFLAQHNTDMVGHHPEEPVSTIVQKGCTQAVVEVSAGVLNMKGSDRRMSDVDEPAPAVTSQGNHLGEVRAFLMKYYGVDQDPRLEEPLSTVTTRDRFGIVMVNGEPYEITDIGMRMLTPRELFKAQGFPADYQIETGTLPDGSTKVLTKTAQVRMCGNSVCPPIAAALVSANCNDMAIAPSIAAE